ncbi:hypothetical protein CH35J_003862 [Colletotrichum higginsianum]|uniref:Uncharacterized protein n=1 Tax=Colletotrichum higginsianum TaxID=80884 RepID=A0A4T0WBD7_9PEZI|nr:hypothetical protein CH35J_003862 [Colletotrichum higginsianum]
MPVPPPNDAIPLELRQKRLVEPSDLRSERMTEANAREALSEYVVYRLEKVNDPDEIDDEGYPAVPTWENVTRTEVRDLSKPVITRTIRHLDDEGKSVMQKKLKLTATQQRQIEKAQNDLETHNHDKRFCYTLQQIDTKMKKLSKDSTEYRQYIAGRESKKVTVSKTKKSKKNLLETTSLTVYFKREPRAGIPADMAGVAIAVTVEVETEAATTATAGVATTTALSTTVFRPATTPNTTSITSSMVTRLEED